MISEENGGAIVGESMVVDIDAIEENDYNPNRQDERTFEAEIESIQLYGFIDDILLRPHPDIDGHYIVIDGAHRLRATQHLGYERVGARVLDVDEETAKKLTVVMNETRGRADKVDLAKLLANLAETQSIDELNEGLPFGRDELQELVDLAANDWDDYGSEWSGDDDHASEAGSGEWESFEVVMTEEDYQTFLEAKGKIDVVQGLSGDPKVRDGQVVGALAAEYLSGVAGE